MPMAYDLNLREYWRTIRKRKGIIIFTVIMMTLSSLVFSIIGRPTPIYRTNASVKVERSGSITGLYIQTVSFSATNYMETQMAMIKSYFIMELVAKKMGLIPADISSDEVRTNPGYLSTILALKGKIDTEQEGNSDIISITATSEDPKQAQRLANTVAAVYKEQHALDLNRRAIEAKKFIEQQVGVTRERLQKAENAVKEYREANRMVTLDSASSGLLARFSELKTRLERDQAVVGRVGEIENLLAEAENKPLSSETVFYIEEASTLYKNLNDRLVQLMLDRDTLLISYTENYPQVVEIKKKIREMTTSMRSQLRAQRKNLTQGVALLQKQLRELDEQLRSLPHKGLELARLEREAAVNREIYILLEKQYQESLIKNAEKIEEVQVVKPALEPVIPINPPKTGATTGLGFVLGTILGIIFAFVIETFDTSIGAVEEVEEFLGVRVLGVVPHVDVEELKATLQEKPGAEVDEDKLWRITRLITHFAPKTTSAESYRALRTNINFVKLEKDIKTLVFTSSSPQEGKTTVSCNLAIAMAQAGKKVLLVDGDLRRPIISKIFGIQSIPGLTDVILGNYEWRSVVRSITDLMMGKMTMEDIMANPGLDNLYVMTCGTIAPNPAELVSTQVNENFLKEAHQEYDFVIVDVPPVLAATDAAIWGTRADGVIIVYQVGKVARGALKRAKAQIDNVKARIIGVVLNGLKAEISPDFEYHDKYYYYGGSEQKKQLTLGERIVSWSDQARAYVRSLPEKVKGYLKGEGRQGVKSGLVKIFLLLLAVVLLLTGLYYQEGATKPSKAVVTLNHSVLVPSAKPEAVSAGAGAVTPPAAREVAGQSVPAAPSPRPDATAAGAVVIPPPAGEEEPEDQVELIFTVRANIRDAGNENSRILSLAKKGEKAIRLGSSGDWHRVRLSSGVTGWVRGDLVKEAE